MTMHDLVVEPTDVEPGIDQDLRRLVVSAAIGVLREQAFHRVGLAQVAAAAGLEPDVVHALYGTIDELLVDVVETWNHRRLQPILSTAAEHGAVAFLRSIVRANVADPALMRLLTASVSVAATPDSHAAVALQHQWIRFHALVQRSLAHDIAVGREPDTMEPARGAEQLIAMYEGLQLQSMLRPNMDVLAAFDRAITRLRDGWSQQYTPPTWEI